MSSSKRLEFGNFVCRFGDSSVLVDRISDVVLPAFLNGYEKKYRKTRIFLHEVRVRKLESGYHAVAGRIVKDTELVRETLYDEESGKLKRSLRTLRSSPTSFFMLILESHRLLYVKEHAGAPTMDQFRSTMQRFLLNAYLQTASSSGKRSKADEPPELSILPIMSGDSVKKFIARFETIKRLRVGIAPVNNEPDLKPAVRYLRKSRENLRSTDSYVVHANKAGLDKDAVEDEVSAVKKGIGTARIEGLDKNGVKLKGDQRNFGLVVPTDELPERTDDAVNQVMRQVSSLIETDSIKNFDVSSSTENRVRKAIERLQ